MEPFPADSQISKDESVRKCPAGLCAAVRLTRTALSLIFKTPPKRNPVHICVLLEITFCYEERSVLAIFSHNLSHTGWHLYPTDGSSFIPSSVDSLVFHEKFSISSSLYKI